MKKILTQILIVVVSAAIIAEATAIISIKERLTRIETLLSVHLHPTASARNNDVTQTQP